MNTLMPVVILALTTGWLVGTHPDLGFVGWDLGYAAGVWVSHRFDRVPKRG